MPKGLKRYYGSGDSHFTTCSCYRRKLLLGTPLRRDLFLTLLEETRQRYHFVVLGYVVMPEHFHLLISEPQKGDPSTVMQVVKQRFAQRLLSCSRKAASEDRARYGRRITNRRTSGRLDLTISTCGPNASGWRSCATCIAIR